MKLKYSCLVIFSILILITGCSRSRTEARDLVFFYLETCPSCEDYQLAETLSRTIQDLNRMDEWNGAAYNVANPENGTRLKKILEEKKLPDISRSLPLLIMGEEYHNGYETIKGILESL